MSWRSIFDRIGRLFKHVAFVSGLVVTLALIVFFVPAIFFNTLSGFEIAWIFAVVTFPIAVLFRSWRIRIVGTGGLIALVAVTATHFQFDNYIVIENSSGHRVKELHMLLSHSDELLAVHDVPDGGIVRVWYESPTFDGEIATTGRLANGTEIASAVDDIEGRHYRRTTRVRVGPRGHVRVIHE